MENVIAVVPSARMVLRKNQGTHARGRVPLDPVHGGYANQRRRSYRPAGGPLVRSPYFFFSSVNTSLATAFSVSKTPVPAMATASNVGSPLKFSCVYI